MRVRLILFVVAAALLTGCGRSGVAVGGGVATPTARASQQRDVGGAQAASEPAYGSGLAECAGSKYDPHEVAAAPPATSLPPGPAGAVDDTGEPVLKPLSDWKDWKIVQQRKREVHLLRKLDDPSGFDIEAEPTHHRVILERVYGATNVEDGTWMLMADGPCTPRWIANDGLRDADLSLARRPPAKDTTIELNVHERDCASGQSAEGRVVVRKLEQTAHEIRLWIGVKPPPGTGWDCQSNPATPFDVELTQRLGDRRIVDVSVVPPRRVTLRPR